MFWLIFLVQILSRVTSSPTGGLYPKETFQQYNIVIGSALGTWDVIKNDLTVIGNPSYDAQASLEALVKVEDKTQLSQFWIAYEGKAEDHKIHLQKPVTTIDEIKTVDGFSDSQTSDLLEARVVSWGKMPLKPVPLATDEAKDLDIAIEYTCHKAGNFKVTVNLRFFEMENTQKTFKDTKFSFLKECKGEEKTVKGVGLADFYVGTSQSTSDVVKNGETMKLWLVREDDEDQEGLTSVEGSEYFVSFWMRYEEATVKTIKKKKESFEASEPVVSVDDPTVVLVETIGELAYGGTIDSTPRALLLKFHCLKSGMSSVAVEVQSPDFPDFLSLFSFNKICDGKGHSEGMPIKGLNIGTESGQGGSDIVRDGITKEKYRNAQQAGESQSPAIIGEEVSVSKFYMSLSEDDSSPDRVKFMRPILVNGQSLGSKFKVVEPQISGAITRASSISADSELTLQIKYNCLREGMADVSVEIPIRPKGALQFMVRKVCPKDSAAVENITPIKLKGLTMGHTKGGAQMIEDGLTTEQYAWADSIDSLKLVPKSKEYLDFFLSVDSKKDKSYRFGTPELISSLDIFYPEIHGRGSSGGFVSNKNSNHFSITFHCLSNGTSLVTVAVPILGDTDDEEPPRDDPLIVNFRKECPLTATRARAEPKLGGVHLKGFSVDFNGASADIVRNGFPTAMYFGQRKKKNPDWEDAIIPKEQESVSLQIYYSSQYGETPSDTVEIGKPSTVPHHSMAKPTLGGSAAVGGKLELDGDPLVLDITFNCQFQGMAAISVIIPIIPHGRITFTIPKTCDGVEHPGRVKISGMNVKVLTEEGKEADVVKDGITEPAFSPYVDDQENFIVFYDRNTTFFIERTGTPLKALSPLVFCHRSWCMPELLHDIPQPEAKDKVVVEGNAASIEIELIEGTKYKLTVVYHCIYGGQSPVSVSIPVLPMGTVGWTWTMVCEETDTWMDDDEFKMDYYDDLKDSFWDSEYDSNYFNSNWNSAQSNFEDLYKGDDFFYDPGFYYDDDLIIGFDADDDYNWADELTGYSVFSGVDEYSYSSYMNVGTGTSAENSNDVVNHGIPQPQWELACKEEKICKVFGVDVKSTTFYYFLESGSAAIDIPVVKATNNKNDKLIVKPSLSGKLVDSYDLNSGQIYDLNVDFNCKAPGVAVMHVSVPLTLSGAMQKQVAFSFLKICGGFTKKEDFSWTASRGLNLGVVMLVGVVLAGPYCWFKKKNNYHRVAQTPGANLEAGEDSSGMMELPEGDDIDSESD